MKNKNLAIILREMSQPNSNILIYVHLGYNDYLDSVFKLTRHFNPSNRIILLGDNDNKHVAEKYSFEFENISYYNQPIPYHHLSVNTEKYEKFCFQRWFIVKNFINKNNIETFIYSDSDNAVLFDFNSDFFPKNGILGNDQIIVPCLFSCSNQDLNVICNFYTQMYSLTKDQVFHKIHSTNYYQLHDNKIFHFSDMFFLKMAVDQLNLKFINMEHEPFSINTQQACFNANINDVGTVHMVDHIFYQRKREDSTLVRLLNIHFAGAAKKYANIFMEKMPFENCVICLT